ncbi:MAG TPA: hypothetical protein VFR17_12450 [Mycobacterium sp.]|nr:hypothetical protein [Mycobacterium sp.]
MKLARPDVFHPRIVLAGDRRSPAEDSGCSDDVGLVDALRTRGLHAHWLAWDDPETLRADLVILRGVRDYPGRFDEFLAWTRRVRNLLNPPEVIAWNAEQRYLSDLRCDGVPTLAHNPPTGGPAAATALVFFGGGRSHAFDAAGRELDPDFELWDLGRAALRAAAERLSIRIEELLYARADMVGELDDARLVGLDLIAPQLGWHALSAGERDGHQRQFALAVESACERLGLGPLSHRRP